MGYVPRREAELVSWAENFARLTSQDPRRYALTAGDARQIAEAVRQFASAYQEALHLADLAAGAQAAKRQAGRAMLLIFRNYGSAIRNNLAVAAQDKINLGLPARKAAPSRVSAPTSWPFVEVQPSAPLRHQLVFSDSDAPERRRRPAGVNGLQLYCCLADQPPREPAEAQITTFCSRDRHMQKFPLSAAGQRAHYWARWQTRRGLVGPWSQRVSLIVAG